MTEINQTEKVTNKQTTKSAASDCCAGADVFTCDMCGNTFDNAGMNLVADPSGWDNEICNSCFWNAGF